MADIPPMTPASAPFPRFARRRHEIITVLAFVTGFLAVLLLGFGILILIMRLNVTLDFGIDQWGFKRTIWLHRNGVAGVLLGFGLWFTLLTRGLWQGRRYGRVMGWITLALAALIAIATAVS